MVPLHTHPKKSVIYGERSHQEELGHGHSKATAMLKQKLWGKEEKIGHGKNKQLVSRKKQRQTDED